MQEADPRRAVQPPGLGPATVHCVLRGLAPAAQGSLSTGNKADRSTFLSVMANLAAILWMWSVIPADRGEPCQGPRYSGPGYKRSDVGCEGFDSAPSPLLRVCLRRGGWSGEGKPSGKLLAVQTVSSTLRSSFPLKGHGKAELLTGCIFVKMSSSNISKWALRILQRRDKWLNC